MRREDADLVDFASLHHHGLAVLILCGSVANVTIEARVLMGGVPDGARVVEVVGEEDFYVAVKGNDMIAGPSTSPSLVGSSWHTANFGVECPSVPSTLPTMGLPYDGHGLINRQVADVAPVDDGAADDLRIRAVFLWHRIWVALDVRHHQAADAGELREVNCHICFHELVFGHHHHRTGRVMSSLTVDLIRLVL